MNKAKKQIQNLNYKTILKKSTKFIPLLVFIIWIFFLLYPVISSHAFITGIDYHFHMNQIYNDAMQIKTHHFSYFLSTYGFNRSGRIVNALYGPFFNYLLGGLLLLCKSWTNFEMTLDFLSLLIGSSLMYLLCRTIHIHKVASTLCGMLYITIAPISISWIGNQEFNGLGGVFTPLAFILGIKLLRQTELKTLPIVLALTFYLQFHLATSLLCGLILSVYLLTKFIVTKYKKAFVIQFVKICLWVLALNANIFGAIYEVYSSNYIIPTFPNLDMQSAGIKLTKNGLSHFGIIFTILVLIIILVVAFSHWKLLDIKITAIICLMSLILYSSYFPWDALIKVFPIISNIIQYPQRFAPTFWCSFLFLLTYVFDTMYYRATVNHANVIWRIIPIIPVVILLFTWMPNIYEYFQYIPKAFYTSTMIRTGGYPMYNKKNRASIRADFHGHQLDKPIIDIDRVNTDYLPAKHALHGDEYDKYLRFHPYHVEISNQNYWKQTDGTKSTKGNQLILHWYRKASQRKLIKAPIILYSHSKLVVNHQVAQHFTDTVGVPIVRSKAGENTAVLTYQPSNQFKTCIFIMSLSWLGLIIIGGHYLIRKWM